MADRARDVGLRGVAALEPRRAALAGALVVVVLGVLGLLFELGAPLGVFDLDVEGTVPAGWSAGLLLTAGSLGALFAWLSPAVSERERTWLYVFGGFLVFMGLDEGLRLHEELDAALNFDWQILYLPIAVAGGWAWLVALRVLSRLGLGRGLLLAGAAAWVLAQAIEIFQHEGVVGPGLIAADVNEAQFERASHGTAYVVSMVAEELLEMGGSLLFGLALLAALRTVLSRGGSRL